MFEHEESARDLAALRVPRRGALRETGEPWQPFRLLDPAGESIEPVSVFFRDRAFIARRRATRPSAEYRTPTEAEWDEFLAHFVLCTTQVPTSRARTVAAGDPAWCALAPG